MIETVQEADSVPHRAQAECSAHADVTALLDLAAPPLPPKGVANLKLYSFECTLLTKRADRKSPGEPSLAVPSNVALAGRFDHEPPHAPKQQDSSGPLHSTSQLKSVWSPSDPMSMPISRRPRSPSPRRPGIAEIDPITIVGSGEKNAFEKPRNSKKSREKSPARCDTRIKVDYTRASSKTHTARVGRLTGRDRNDLFPGLDVDTAGAEGSALSLVSARKANFTQKSIDASGILPMRTTIQSKRTTITERALSSKVTCPLQGFEKPKPPVPAPHVPTHPEIKPPYSAKMLRRSSSSTIGERPRCPSLAETDASSLMILDLATSKDSRIVGRSAPMALKPSAEPRNTVRTSELQQDPQPVSRRALQRGDTAYFEKASDFAVETVKLNHTGRDQTNAGTVDHYHGKCTIYNGRQTPPDA